MASLAGLIPLPASTAYVGAKHAVVGMSLALRHEARRHGVSVSVVCPAVVDTSIFDESRSRYVNFEVNKVLAIRRGVVLSAEDCAKKMLAGVRRNRAIILPGPARWLWLAHRYFPFLTTWMVRGMMRSLLGAHRSAASLDGGQHSVDS
jgi:short-subunit dehydrogenase